MSSEDTRYSNRLKTDGDAGELRIQPAGNGYLRDGTGLFLARAAPRPGRPSADSMPPTYTPASHDSPPPPIGPFLLVALYAGIPPSAPSHLGRVYITAPIHLIAGTRQGFQAFRLGTLLVIPLLSKSGRVTMPG